MSNLIKRYPTRKETTNMFRNYFQAEKRYTFQKKYSCKASFYEMIKKQRMYE